MEFNKTFLLWKIANISKIREVTQCSPHAPTSVKTNVLPLISSISLTFINGFIEVWASLVAQMVKNLPAQCRRPGFVPGSGRSFREGNFNPLQYSCLESSMDSGAWWTTVHWSTELDMGLNTYWGIVDLNHTYLKCVIWCILTYVHIPETIIWQDNEHIHYSQEFPCVPL